MKKPYALPPVQPDPNWCNLLERRRRDDRIKGWRGSRRREGERGEAEKGKKEEGGWTHARRQTGARGARARRKKVDNRKLLKKRRKRNPPEERKPLTPGDAATGRVTNGSSAKESYTHGPRSERKQEGGRNQLSSGGRSTGD